MFAFPFHILKIYLFNSTENTLFGFASHYPNRIVGYRYESDISGICCNLQASTSSQIPCCSDSLKYLNRVVRGTSKYHNI